MKPADIVASLDRQPARQRYISTGSPALDIAIGGWPIGRLSEVTGDPMTGKTSLLYLAARLMQKLQDECPVLFVDYRGEFSRRRAKACGVDTERLVVSRTLPDSLGPISWVVADCVESPEHRRALLRNTADGVTVVAASWLYRQFPGVYPWVHLTPVRQGEKLASCQTSESAEISRYLLFPSDYGFDLGRELLELAVLAGKAEQRGSHWYWTGGGPSDPYLGSGREEAGIALRKVPGLLMSLRNALRR